MKIITLRLQSAARDGQKKSCLHDSKKSVMTAQLHEKSDIRNNILMSTPNNKKR